MALTLQAVRAGQATPGQFREAVWDITFDTSYPTGGYAVTAHDFGVGRELMGITECAQGLVAGTVTATSYKLTYDPGTKKIQLFVSAADTVAFGEVAAAVNLATRKIRVRVIGI